MNIKLVVLVCLLSLTLQMSGLECNVPGCESCSASNVCEVCSENYAKQTIKESGAFTCIRVDCPSNCESCD
jgi:hypothetical protein